MKEEIEQVCTNCNKEIRTPFCGYCGQENIGRLNFKHLYHLFQHGIIELQSPFFQLLIGLIVRPFETIKAYIHGQRERYFNPLRFAFYVTTFSMLTIQFFDISLESFIAAYTVHDQISYEEHLATTEKIVQYHIPLMFILCFFLALVHKVFYRRIDYSYVDLLIGYLLIGSLNSIIMTILFISLSNQLNLAYQISTLLYSAYIVSFIASLDNHSGFKAWIKATLFYISYIVAIMITLVLIPMFL